MQEEEEQEKNTIDSYNFPSQTPEEKMYDKPPFPEAQNMNQIYNLLKLLIKN